MQIEGWIEESAPHRLLASNISLVEGPLALEADLTEDPAATQISSVVFRLEICGMAPVLQLPVRPRKRAQLGAAASLGSVAAVY